MDYYQLFSINYNASTEEINDAYRRLAKQAHPDVNGSVEEFKQIQEAYEVLSDHNKRASYNLRFNFINKVRNKTKKKLSDEEIRFEEIKRKDPNMGNIQDAPPPKHDLWGNPIDTRKDNFIDSVIYDGGDVINLR